MDYSKLTDEELQDIYLKTYNSQSNYKVRRSGFKIFANSGFGALGNPYMRWYDIRLAESITKTSQVVIQWIIRDLNAYFNNLLKTENVDYVIYGDTDSSILCLEYLVDKFYDKNVSDEEILEFIDTVCKEKIDNVIKKSIDNFSKYTNAFKPKIKMGREVIANKGIWTGKKHYAMRVLDKEGVRFKTPKIVIKGLESQRSSTPSAFRKGIKEAVNVILNKDEKALIEFVENYKEKFPDLAFDEYAFPKGINGMKKYGDVNTIYSKGTPAQVKGSLIYNYLLKEKGLDSKYPEIYDGDKIKFVYLKMPNPIGFEIISTPGRNIPVELDLDPYIDREASLEKGFINPIKSMANAIGWKFEDTSDLSEFFENGEEGND